MTATSVKPNQQLSSGNASNGAKWLDRNRIALANKLAHAVTSDPLLGGQSDLAIFEPLIDHLAVYLKKEDSFRLEFFCGSVRKRFRIDGLLPPDQLARYFRFFEHVKQEVVLPVDPFLDSAERQRLSQFMNRSAEYGPPVGGKPLKAMIIGDCFFLDVLSFLETGCTRDSVEPRWLIVDSKNPLEARNRIRSLAKEKPQAIFYSPYTYEFSLPLRCLNHWRSGFLGASQLSKLIEEASREVDYTIQLLSSLECPVFIQNSVFVRRHDGSLVDQAKSLITYPVRSRTSRIIQKKIEESIQLHNLSRNLFCIDEQPFLKQLGDRKLGHLVYNTKMDHFANLGIQIWPEYRDRIYTINHLLGKKLLVCDLDDTLWHGLIGEGKVRQDPQRQGIVRRLRERGVVLAVNSKNDPSKVRWDDCLLKPEDFVSIQINWEPKPFNMQQIQRQLNLKPKDFVFIDDRADQRELVRHSMPEIHTLDATSDRSWRLLELWAELLTETPEMDRTQMYRQREERERFLNNQTMEDPGELFKNLEITVDIHRVRNSEIKRAAELINRTNQFNLTGARTTSSEVAKWAADPAWRVYVVESGDKFGDNGVVAILVTHQTPKGIEIPSFVLSCRVFGYGIETAAINLIKRELRVPGQKIIGRFVATAHNQPCADFYSRHGFIQEGDHWIHSKTSSHDPDPAWLKVSVQD